MSTQEITGSLTPTVQETQVAQVSPYEAETATETVNTTPMVAEPSEGQLKSMDTPLAEYLFSVMKHDSTSNAAIAERLKFDTETWINRREDRKDIAAVDPGLEPLYQGSLELLQRMEAFDLKAKDINRLYLEETDRLKRAAQTMKTVQEGKLTSGIISKDLYETAVNKVDAWYSAKKSALKSKDEPFWQSIKDTEKEIDGQFNVLIEAARAIHATKVFQGADADLISELQTFMDFPPDVSVKQAGKGKIQAKNKQRTRNLQMVLPDI